MKSCGSLQVHGRSTAGIETMRDGFMSDICRGKWGHRSWPDLRRFSFLAVLTFVAGSLVWNVVLAAPLKSKKAAMPKGEATADDMNAAADKDAADGPGGLRQDKDPPNARLKIQDNFNVDQPVTKELLAALDAMPPCADEWSNLLPHGRPIRSWTSPSRSNAAKLRAA